MSVRNWQQIEGIVVFILAAAAAITFGDWPIWLLLLCLFVPDLSAIGYVFGARAGAFVYNLFHLYASGALMVALGYSLRSDNWVVLGLLFIAHVGVDRAAGFGLKLNSGFKDTHLGRIGG